MASFVQFSVHPLLSSNRIHRSFRSVHAFVGAAFHSLFHLGASEQTPVARLDWILCGTKVWNCECWLLSGRMFENSCSFSLFCIKRARFFAAVCHILIENSWIRTYMPAIIDWKSSQSYRDSIRCANMSYAIFRRLGALALDWIPQSSKLWNCGP